MATVEELQEAAERLMHDVQGPIQIGIACALGGSTARHVEIAKDFDDLTAAYRALGRAEGAEQMAAKVKEEGDHIREGFCVGISDHMVYDEEDKEDHAGCDLYIVPASVLVPTEPEVSK